MTYKQNCTYVLGILLFILPTVILTTGPSILISAETCHRDSVYASLCKVAGNKMRAFENINCHLQPALVSPSLQHCRNACPLKIVDGATKAKKSSVLPSLGGQATSV